ncbi:MAG: Gfo/Idh/MocA family oxidoreductase [Bryobacteraceae bacterium]
MERLLTQSEKPLRIGILGAAAIAREFVRGVRGSSKLTVETVASRDPLRAQSFANELGLRRHTLSYEDLLADPDIDAIYNPLPNSLHAHWSVLAMRAGKHVLCEKPLAANADEARLMVQAAKENGVHLVEAYPYRSQPLTIKMLGMLAAGEIGSVEMIHADFGFPMSNESNIRLDPALKGGSLWDAGCYPVSLARMVAGMRPIRAQAVATWTSTGVDKTVAATLEFPNGLMAQVSCSFNTAVHRHATIVGTAGVIRTDYPNNPSMESPATLQIKRGARGTRYETVEAPAMNGFLAEAESFCDLVRHGPAFWNGVTNEESIDILLTLDAIHESAQRRAPVDIASEE